METITIGSDPEFELTYPNGRPLGEEDLQEILPNSVRARIGIDGAGNIGEIRPQPAKTATQHIRNIKKLLWKINKQYLNEQIHMKCSGQRPTGGHIHFGTPYNSEIVKALDIMNAVLEQLLPQEMRKMQAERNANGYGKLGEYKENTHGFEYRTPPTWIYTPQMAKTYLTIAHIIAQETTENTNKNKELIQLYQNEHKQITQKNLLHWIERMTTPITNKTQKSTDTYLTLNINIKEFAKTFINHLKTYKLPKTNSTYRKLLNQIQKMIQNNQKFQIQPIQTAWKLKK